MFVIPVHNILIVPDANIYLKTQEFRYLSRQTEELNGKVVLLSTREKTGREEITEDVIYPIGVMGYVSEVSEDGYIVIRTTGRVKLDKINVTENHAIELNVSRCEDVDDLDPATEREHLEELKEQMKETTKSAGDNEQVRQIIGYIDQYTTIAEIAVSLSVWTNMTPDERFAILQEDSRTGRMEKMERAIYEFLEVARASNLAAVAQQQDHQKMYREAAIKKQMEYLQKELDELHPENVTDVQRFAHKIAESGMNDTARREAEKVLNRLRQENGNSMESGMLYDYLDFVTGLSWKKEESPQIDLKEAEEILNADHFGLDKVKKRIIQQIAVMNLKKEQSGSILLFVGAPGTGKTSIGQSIATALHREYVRVSLGGVRDEADIRGHRRTYVGAMPGRIMDGIQKSGVSNPVMVLDEVDKLSASYNGDPASALLEVLDPEQNHTFTDHYMNVPYDLSDVMFICTANSVDTIPGPLLDRMEVIRFTGYTAADKFQIARRHLLPKAMQTMGIGEGQLLLSDDVLRTIISDYTMEAGVRGLRSRMDTLCRSAAVALAKGETSITVKEENLREMLDTRPIRHGRVLENNKPGIVTGLAWTAAGGEILYIETLLTKGNGKVTVTGQLGDVMKESVQIAVSLVKSIYPEQAAVLEESDLHIHVPEGAVPKDGPSAGITMTTALASLLTGRTVSPLTGMTGEVSLRGAVTAIGGLPEKLMAAVRAGIKTVYIPKENEEDLEEVAEEVREKLTIIPVSEITKVLDAVLEE